MARTVSTPHNAYCVTYLNLSRHISEEDYDNEYEFQLLLESITETLMERYPSLYPVNKWIDREDKVILENRLVQIGVSEYCGLMALWVIPRYENDYSVDNLSQKFSRTIEPTINGLGDLRKVATFSNGEAMYEQTINS